MVMFILYISSASMLEEMYEKLTAELWALGPRYLNDKQNQDNRLFYNYTLQYIQKYPIYATFGSLTVSKINAITFCIGLAITKALSFAVIFWIEEHF